jgi:ABC-type Zn uptake system ZnuABC Zn-binding protein ZnuA
VTTRLFIDRLVPWQIATVALAAVEGVAGLLLSFWTDAPPGATIAVVAGAVFAAVALVRALRARRAALAAVAAIGVAGIAGCGSSDTDSGRLQVVATTPVVADFARQVGGDAVDVVQLLQPNSDPHAYEPRPSDVRHTADGKVVLESGVQLDHWMADVIEQSGAHPDVVDLSARLPVKLGDDPHWWHDPENAIAAVTAISTAFAQAEPDKTATFDANATAYIGRLQALQQQVRRCVDAVPAAQRKLVTDHDALDYWARRYGVDVIGAVIPSQSTQAQPSAGEVADLVQTIRDQHVLAVFPESSVNPKLARTIARQTGAGIGEELYADTLGPEGSPGATYLQAERHNADAIVRGFTGGARGCGDA